MRDLHRLTAREARAALARRDVSPLELVEAAAARIAEIEPAVNALPTLCLDRARDHARRLMRGEGRELEDAAGGGGAAGGGMRVALVALERGVAPLKLPPPRAERPLEPLRKPG